MNWFTETLPWLKPLAGFGLLVLGVRLYGILAALNDLLEQKARALELENDEKEEEIENKPE